MHIDHSTLESVAKVARLSLTDEEKTKFLPQLNSALDAFSTLSEVNTSGVEPSFHPLRIGDPMRDDISSPSLTQEQSLSLTAQKIDGYFKGPSAV